MDNRFSFALAVWSLVSLVILWALPKDTYMQGSIAGLLLGIAGAVVAFQVMSIVKRDREEGRVDR